MCLTATRIMRASLVALCAWWNTAGFLHAGDFPKSFHPPKGLVRTSWVGNSFGGNGGPNGYGYWVQNAAARAVVTPDGTVIAGIEWDEAGRCVGLYKDGRVNRSLLKAEGGKLPESAWGWGTANDGAVTALGDMIFVGTKGKKLLRFRWKPGNLESAKFVGAVDLKESPVTLDARGDILALGFKDRIEFRSAANLKVQGGFQLAGVRDLAIAPDKSVWVLARGRVRRYTSAGNADGQPLPDTGKPAAIAFGHHKGRLFVCDDGPRQQVLVFDASGKSPRRVRTIGRKGGLRAEPAGRADPDKLFSLRGAGTDRDGNVYVAMSFGSGPNGSLTLRSFTPSGKLRWELQNYAFVDTYGFDPDKDGTVVYGRLGIIDLDLSHTRPGSEWSLRAITLDHVGQPNDPRLKKLPSCTAIVRRLNGKRMLYTIGQYAGGYNVFTFDEPDGMVARAVDRIHANDSWAWDVSADGAIWHGDAPKRTIRRYPFGGWVDGKPSYNWKKPESWNWPKEFQLIRRVIYDVRTDSLYVFGYLKGEKIDSWGVIGRTARRYDGWRTGKRKLVWTKSLPMTPDGNGKGKPLSAESVTIVGDYLFIGMCKPQDGRQYIHILQRKDAHYVGSLWPGKAVGGQAGWLDMPYAIQGIKRRNGEYLLLVEEDFRGKNLLYRWKP